MQGTPDFGSACCLLYACVPVGFSDVFPPDNFDLALWAVPLVLFYLSGLKKMQSSLKLVDCVIEVHDARISFHAVGEHLC